MSKSTRRPVIVGLGGTTRPNSSTEKAMRYTLNCAEALGATTIALGSSFLDLPLYEYAETGRIGNALHIIEALRQADGIILASPGYHGSLSGLMKNAIDYAEDMRNDVAPYFDGRAVGCIVTAGGWQATTTTLQALRSIVHALRGWPVPMGATLNTTEPVFDLDGHCLSPAVERQLSLVADQVVQFAQMKISLAA